MTEASCIYYPDEKRVLVLRKALIVILETAPDSHVAAGILSQFIFWTDIKINHMPQAKHHNRAAANESLEPAQDEELWIYKTAEELQQELMGIAGETRVIQNLKWLMDNGFLERRSNPKYRWDKTFQYRLNITFTQARIENRKSTVSMSQDYGLNAVDLTPPSRRNNTAIPEVTTEVTPKRNKAESSANSSAQPVIEPPEETPPPLVVKGSPDKAVGGALPRSMAMRTVQGTASGAWGEDAARNKKRIDDLPEIHPARLLVALMLELKGSSQGLTTLSDEQFRRLESPIMTIEGQSIPSALELHKTYPQLFADYINESVRSCFNGNMPRTFGKAIDMCVSPSRQWRITAFFEEHGVELIKVQKQAQKAAVTPAWDTKLEGSDEGDFFDRLG